LLAATPAEERKAQLDATGRPRWSAHAPVRETRSHDLPYLWHGDNAEELRARGMPLGLMLGMGYEEETTLLPGEGVLFYNDGLVEAHNPEGEMFGFPRLRALVAEYGEERSLGDSLLEELYSYVGESWEQENDITLLTLERSATRS
jgi:serine phosphatase RsbU (regulator of sigma subunit)